MINFDIVAKVDVTITEEDLKQLIIEKVAELRPDVEIKDINFSGSRKKGTNINIDIDAELKGAVASKPTVGKKMEAVVNEQVEKAHAEPEISDAAIKKIEAVEESHDLTEMQLIDEVLAEHDDEPIEEELKITKTTSLADLLS